MNIFELFWKVICEVFGIGIAPIAFESYTVWHGIVGFLGGLVISAVIAGVIFLAGFIIFKILKGIFTLLRNIFSAKTKCKKIQCRTCGRTLDKCTCAKNQGRGYIRRLALFSKETRDLKRKNKKG